MQVIVENDWQARKVRVVVWVSALWCAGFLYWAYDLALTFGMSPGDGGALRPLGTRLGVAALVALIGVAPFVGMMAYARLYVIRLCRDRDNVLVTVVGILRPVTLSPHIADIGRAHRHAGRLRLRSIVNAPWITLRIAGWPYIIDLQSERIDTHAIDTMMRIAERSRTRRQRET